jgi:hypothetical protein
VADPFVIALERVPGLTVVTAERASGSLQKPRIPDVCTGVGVESKARNFRRSLSTRASTLDGRSCLRKPSTMTRPQCACSRANGCAPTVQATTIRRLSNDLKSSRGGPSVCTHLDRRPANPDRSDLSMRDGNNGMIAGRPKRNWTNWHGAGS